MTWTAAIGGELCGLCGVTFAQGDAMFISSVHSKRRCPMCRPDVPIDWAAVQAARERHALNREAAAAGPTPTKIGVPSAPVLNGFAHIGTANLHAVLKTGGGIRGVRRASSPKPHATVAHLADAKARAVND